MIKCNVTVCGNISRSAEEKTSHEGNKFISYSNSFTRKRFDS